MDCHPLGSSVPGILQKEHWSGLPFLSPGDLPDPGIEPESPELAGGPWATGEAHTSRLYYLDPVLLNYKVNSIYSRSLNLTVIKQ